jgi:hypothetical protein
VPQVSRAGRQMNQQISILLQVLRRETDHLDWPSGGTESLRFASICEYHQVAPFVFCQLNNTKNAAPAGLVEYLRKRFFEISARNYRLAKAAVDLASFLQEHDIPVIAFKGPVVAIVAYGDLALRQYQDIDLVIQDQDLNAAADLLLRRSFQFAPESCRPDNPKDISRSHEVTLAAPDKSYFVDLHWRLASEEVRGFCPDVEKMRDRVEEIQLPQGSVLTLCREDLFLALCCHGTKHRWGRLKWLLDIAEILRSPASLDWDRVVTMTLERPVAQASVSLAILLAHDLLHTSVPDALPPVLKATKRTRFVASAIHSEILTRGRTNGLVHHHPTLAHLKGSIPAWIDYLWVRYPKWFFEHAVVRIDPKDRAAVSLPQQLAFLYHIVRPARLVGKYGTRFAQRALSSHN